MDGLLVMNAGSSSLKFGLYALKDVATSLQLQLRGQIAGIGHNSRFEVYDQQGDKLTMKGNQYLVDSHIDAIKLVLDWIHKHHSDVRLIGVGHRVVHGGLKRKLAERVSNTLISELEALNPLAPHHQPHNLSAIRTIQAMDPDLPQVACYDTAFHANQPDVARRLPLPLRYQQKGLMRYGFHGLSYQYITSTLPEFNGGELPSRLIIAHLGNGASLCAVKEGISIATTMGFSTLDGLIMGTRSGSLDPGVLLHLMREENMGEPELGELVYNQSGLLGISDISSDMQVLLQSKDEAARQAIDSFLYSLQQNIGSLISTLQGIDGLVFTGGIGEHAAEIRADLCQSMHWLGLKINERVNRQHGPLISTSDSAVKVWVLPTNEELVIAQQAFNLIAEQKITA